MPRRNRKKKSRADRRRERVIKSSGGSSKKKRKKPSKDQRIAAKIRRRLREEAAPGRGVTKQDRKNVFEYYGRRCLRCGSTRRLVLDHVKALYCGGRHDPDNLQPLCWVHNQEKGIKTADYRPFPFYY